MDTKSYFAIMYSKRVSFSTSHKYFSPDAQSHLFGESDNSRGALQHTKMRFKKKGIN